MIVFQGIETRAQHEVLMKFGQEHDVIGRIAIIPFLRICWMAYYFRFCWVTASCWFDDSSQSLLTLIPTGVPAFPAHQLTAEVLWDNLTLLHFHMESCTSSPLWQFAEKMVKTFIVSCLWQSTKSTINITNLCITSFWAPPCIPLLEDLLMRSGSPYWIPCLSC